jgi:hypothetical protein
MQHTKPDPILLPILLPSLTRFCSILLVQSVILEQFGFHDADANVSPTPRAIQA